MNIFKNLQNEPQIQTHHQPQVSGWFTLKSITRDNINFYFGVPGAIGSKDSEWVTYPSWKVETRDGMEGKIQSEFVQEARLPAAS